MREEATDVASGAHKILTAAFCTAALAVIAAAAFCAMNLFTRPVFGNNPLWQLCFAALAACVAFCGIRRLPLLSFAVCTAVAVAMRFYTPLYIPVFYPFALGAVALGAAGTRTGPGLAAVGLSYGFSAAALLDLPRLRQFFLLNPLSFPEQEPVGEKYVCLAGLTLATAFWFVLAVRPLRSEKKKKTAKKNERSRKQRKPRRPAEKQKPQEIFYRAPAAYLLCAVNTVSAGLWCAQLFTAEFVKTVFFAAALLPFYLFCIRDPALRGLLPSGASANADRRTNSADRQISMG